MTSLFTEDLLQLIIEYLDDKSLMMFFMSSKTLYENFECKTLYYFTTLCPHISYVLRLLAYKNVNNIKFSNTIFKIQFNDQRKINLCYHNPILINFQGIRKVCLDQDINLSNKTYIEIYYIIFKKTKHIPS